MGGVADKAMSLALKVKGKGQFGKNQRQGQYHLLTWIIHEKFSKKEKGIC
jgi:hypothetical protein